jgi:hypothetical protein
MQQTNESFVVRQSCRVSLGLSTMRAIGIVMAAALVCDASTTATAVEGPTAAGPIGGTDIRSAFLPPPGIWGGMIGLAATAFDFVDGNGNTIPGLSTAHLEKQLAAPFFVYVPDAQVFGGKIGFLGVVPYGEQCGHLFAFNPTRCMIGIGDGYLEVAWSRSFGTLRPSTYPGAYPILEGLTILAGFGVVLPTGKYDALDATSRALSIGNNIHDFAPTVAVTYTTQPILAEGTEISAKFYWNNYLTNPTTHYYTGSLLDVDFAVSERIGRLQGGVAGFYAFQIADDKLFGFPIPPDGRRAEILELGGVMALDFPEYNASVKIKVLSTVITANTVRSTGVVAGWVKQFR